MKKLKRIFIIILLMIVVATGCKDNKEDEDKANLDKNSDMLEDEIGNPIDKEENKEDKAIKTMDAFSYMIKPQTNASELADYIKANIQYVNREDAEKMIEYLLIYQTEIIDDFNNKIYEDGYLEALNLGMNGELDEAKLDNISDESIKADYKELIDSILTIRRYEEHPAVESDWKALKEFSSFVSQDFREMINLYSKIQNYEYNREQLEVEAISQDIIKTESLLKNQQSDFIEKKALELYDLQIYALLIGPEGTYLDWWMDKDSREYKDIIGLIEKYSDSSLAKIIFHIKESKIESIMDVIEIINTNLQFGLKSDYYIETIDCQEGIGEYKILQIRMPDDEIKEDSINSAIKKDIHQYIENTNADEEFLLTTYLNYEDEQYISYEVFIDYYNSKSSDSYDMFYRTFDYVEEKYISLEDYLGQDFQTIKKDLEEISGKSIETLPEFQLIPSGISLLLKEEDGMEGYIHLNHKDLLPYTNKNSQ